jgi:murein DD-endopeptidase MepM/ murein hydrolase activator NlpD
MMTIALYFKPSTLKVCFSLLVFIYMIIQPSYASASFFSTFVTKVFGAETQATQGSTPENDTAIHNSQNIPLLESSINPDVKNIKDAPTVANIEDEALLPNSSPLGTDTDSELEKYASTQKIDVYIVKKGDTLEGIAKKFKVPQNTIINLNADLKKSDLLKIGQKLAILPTKDQEVETPTTKVAVKKDETKKVEESAPATKKAEPKAVDSEQVFTINTDLITQAQKQTTSTAPIAQVTLPVANVGTTVSSGNKPEESGQPSGSINGGYIWPFSEGVGRVSQGLHADQAYDFAAPKGTPIRAVQSGTVLIAKTSGYNGGYGLYVVINFDDGRQAIFGHMSKVAVGAGTTVKQGDIIGYVGSTGKSTGPHVHIGFRGNLSNPYIGLKVNSKSLDSHHD